MKLHALYVDGRDRQRKRADVIIAAVGPQAQTAMDAIELHVAQDLFHHPRQFRAFPGGKLWQIRIELQWRTWGGLLNSALACLVDRLRDVIGLAFLQLNPGFGLQEPAQALGVEGRQSEQISEVLILERATDDPLNFGA
jgi:hypothetical protein